MPIASALTDHAHGVSYSKNVSEVLGSTQWLPLPRGLRAYLIGSVARLPSTGQMVAIARPAMILSIINSSSLVEKHVSRCIVWQSLIRQLNEKRTWMLPEDRSESVYQFATECVMAGS